jgi:phage-related protein
LQSLESNLPLEAAEQFVVGLPAYVQALLGFIFPFVLAFTSTYIERFLAIIGFIVAALPSVLFSVLERVLRVVTQVLDWVIDALTAFVELLRAFLSIFFWPFEQLAKLLASGSDNPA